ncbi:hypothetical protein PVAND_013578 [Polypedilum vanderplanki]|uniref:Serine/threonine-protein kinase PLK4 n=1 Tax=Polypedilum vanderplanki TaxID=319348 RepID=A0A9J6CR41_POLVA|nr:hypothetical protein PVAND_013578 [Polypedilum vanderplanki]
MDEFSLDIEDYDIYEELGKGGFATVYRARCRPLNQEVAIKMIDKHQMQAKNMTERVQQEVHIHARLKHPSILDLYTFFEDNNYVYLVLELAHKGTLYKYLNGRTLSEGEAAYIISQVANGLMYLQSNKIMHRDISMSNLLLTANMQVKISDFGLATQIDQFYGNKHTTLCGTPNYISPEVATRSSHGLKTDNWSLGCLLYTLLVGRPPFDTNGVKSTLTQVVMGNYSIPNHLSAEAQDLIKQLLCKDQSKRIELKQVIAHSFFSKYSNIIHNSNHMKTLDSGIVTFSTSSKHSTRSRSMEVLNSIHNNNNFQNPVEQTTPHVIGSLYRCMSSVSLSKQQQQSIPITSMHSQQHQQYSIQMNPIVSYQKKLDVPPLCTTRLQPTRHQMKNVVMSIMNEPRGEVVVELLKYKAKSDEYRVMEVCRISNDGLRIVIYQPNKGKGIRMQNQPPATPNDGVDFIYSYENLPEKHFKKYLYAHRFIQMVRAKTPKVTFYSELAKCQLMETLEDFEMILYNSNGTVTKRKGTSCEFHIQLDTNINEQQQPTHDQQKITQHAEECYQHCVNIEKLLSLTSLNQPCFPIIIGRRPSENNLDDGKNVLQDHQNTFNNYISSSQTPLRTPKINMPSFSLEQTPSPIVKPSISNANNYRYPETPTSSPQYHNQHHKMTSTTIPGIGHATLLSDGTFEINYFDGSRIIVLTEQQGSGIVYSASNIASSIRYHANDLMPEVVKSKFNQLPNILSHLKPRDVGFITSTPLQHQEYNPVFHSNRLNHMKFMR